MSIRVVTFDWGDTLAANYGMPYLHVHRQALDAYAEALVAAGGQRPQDWLDECMAELLSVWHDSIDPIKNPDWQEADIAGLCHRWTARIIDPQQAPQAVQAAAHQLWRRCTDVVRPYGGCRETLQTLAAEGYRLGILSHVAWPPDACQAWFVRWGLADYLDFYSFSSEVGWIKPNPRHFAHAVDLAGVAPEHILHVGDHPLRDINGARAHGLGTCLRLTERMHPDADLATCRPDHVITNIDELPDLLAGLDR